MNAELDSQKVLDRLFPAEDADGADQAARARAEERRRRRLRLRRLALRIQRHLWKVGFLISLVLLWVALHIYYYNRLVDMDFAVKVAWAQVEAQLQRRHNIQHNMTLLVAEYAKHERGLHERLTRMRTGREAVKPGTSPAKDQKPLADLAPRQLDSLFPQIKMVAEQYPQLRLSENFQQFSKAIIDNENQIVTQIMAYNSAVNRMGTVLRQVPGNIFGPVCGFRLARYQYFHPDRSTLPYRSVEASR